MPGTLAVLGRICGCPIPTCPNLRSLGRWLQNVAFAHAGAGAIQHRGDFADIIRNELVGPVPDKVDLTIAFWVMI